MKMRGIKPDFWTDEDVVEVSAFARLLFIGLWHMSCDNGHVKDSPKRIKMSILPADPVDAAALLRELAEAGLIERAGKWITVPNLARHQRIDRRYFLTCEHAGCVKPAVGDAENPPVPADPTTGTRRGHAGATPGPRDEGEGEGEGEGEAVVTSVGADNAPKTAPAKRGSRLAADFIPSESAQNAVRADAAGIDLHREHARFIDYWTAQPGQRGVKTDWNATWRNWMRRAADDAKRNGSNGKSRRQQETDDLFERAAQRMGVTNQLSIEGKTA